MLFKKKAKSQINFLDLTPVRKLEHTIKEDGNVDVLVPRFKSNFAKRFLTPKNQSEFIRANLDKVGSKVWLAIDGEKTVFEISKDMKAELGEEIEPVYDRLAVFMRHLYSNSFIYFKELIKGDLK